MPLNFPNTWGIKRTWETGESKKDELIIDSGSLGYDVIKVLRLTSKYLATEEIFESLKIIYGWVFGKRGSDDVFDLLKKME